MKNTVSVENKITQKVHHGLRSSRARNTPKHLDTNCKCDPHSFHKRFTLFHWKGCLNSVILVLRFVFQSAHLPLGWLSWLHEMKIMAPVAPVVLTLWKWELRSNLIIYFKIMISSVGAAGSVLIHYFSLACLKLTGLSVSGLFCVHYLLLLQWRGMYIFGYFETQKVLKNQSERGWNCSTFGLMTSGMEEINRHHFLSYFL